MSAFVSPRRSSLSSPTVNRGKIIASAPPPMPIPQDCPDRFHKRAIVLDGPLLIPHRLSVLENLEVAEENSFELSRVLILAGEISQSASLLDHLMSSARGENEALYLAGHRSNLDFIALSEEHLLSKDGSHEVLERHRALLRNFGPFTDIRDAYCDTRKLKRLFRGRDPFSLLHLNLFSYLGLAESMADRDCSRQTCIQQLHLINLMKLFCPEIAWDRYSPLIAQALRLRMYDFAMATWREARSCGLISYRDSSSCRLRRYVQLQRKNWSIEWKIHEYLGACILIGKGRYQAAARRLGELKDRLTIFPEPYLRVAVDVLFESVHRHIKRQEHQFNWPERLRVSSHATYLIAWPVR